MQSACQCKPLPWVPEEPVQRPPLDIHCRVDISLLRIYNMLSITLASGLLDYISILMTAVFHIHISVRSRGFIRDIDFNSSHFDSTTHFCCSICDPGSFGTPVYQRYRTHFDAFSHDAEALRASNTKSILMVFHPDPHYHITNSLFYFCTFKNY